MTTLLDKVASGAMRAFLDEEAKTLTKIGNDMQIRHFETSKTPLTDGEVDYLFGRMATFILHALRATSRLA